VNVITQIEALFERAGGQGYLSAPLQGPAAVSALEHALQCAQLAEWAHADLGLVAAALLHDIGELMATAPQDEPHELPALALLSAGGFGPATLEPIRLHVQAKRYLVAVDEADVEGLSPKSQRSPMSAEQRLVFMAQPHAPAALQLRRWDDLARHPGKHTPPLGYYLDLLQDLLQANRRSPRVALA